LQSNTKPEARLQYNLCSARSRRLLLAYYLRKSGTIDVDADVSKHPLTVRPPGLTSTFAATVLKSSWNEDVQREILLQYLHAAAAALPSGTCAHPLVQLCFLAVLEVWRFVFVCSEHRSAVRQQFARLVWSAAWSNLKDLSPSDKSAIKLLREACGFTEMPPGTGDADAVGADSWVHVEWW